MARSTGAAPRQRGSSEKCTLTIGTAASTWGLMSRPKATTTPSSAPASITSSTRSVTGRPRARAAALTGLGQVAAPAPALVRLGDDQADVVAGLDQRPQRRDGRLRGAEEDETAEQGLQPLPGRRRRRRRVLAVQGPPAQLPQGRLALVLVELLEQQGAVEVVELVLEQPGRPARRPRWRPRCRRGRSPVRWTSLGRTIGKYRPGIDRQPSSYSHSPRDSAMTGLTMTLGPSSSLSW